MGPQQGQQQPPHQGQQGMVDQGHLSQHQQGQYQLPQQSGPQYGTAVATAANIPTQIIQYDSGASQQQAGGLPNQQQQLDPTAQAYEYPYGTNTASVTAGITQQQPVYGQQVGLQQQQPEFDVAQQQQYQQGGPLYDPQQAAYQQQPASNQQVHHQGVQPQQLDPYNLMNPGQQQQQQQHAFPHSTGVQPQGQSQLYQQGGQQGGQQVAYPGHSSHPQPSFQVTPSSMPSSQGQGQQQQAGGIGQGGGGLSPKLFLENVPMGVEPKDVVNYLVSRGWPPKRCTLEFDNDPGAGW